MSNMGSSEQALPPRPLRLHSPILAAFPWFSGVIVSPDAEVSIHQSVSPTLKQYFKNIQTFETGFTQDHSIFRWTMRQVLRHQIDVDSATYRSALSAVDKDYLCSLISAYRLLDIMALVLEMPVLSPPMQHPKCQTVGKLSKKGWEKLQDWPKLVKDFCTTMLTTSSPSAVDATDSNPLVAHMKTLSHLAGQSDNLKIMFNIQLAVLHLSFMFQETPRLDSSPPDMPVNKDAFFPEESESATVVSLNDQEGKFLRVLLEKEPHNMRRPLQLALLVSPIYLFMTKSLHKTKWDKLDILLISKALGNQKPAALLIVERLIWQSVIQITTREVALIPEVKRLASVLRDVLGDVLEVDPCASSWFPQSAPTPDLRDRLLRAPEILQSTATPAVWPTGAVPDPAVPSSVPRDVSRQPTTLSAFNRSDGQGDDPDIFPSDGVGRPDEPEFSDTQREGQRRVDANFQGHERRGNEMQRYDNEGPSANQGRHVQAMGKAADQGGSESRNDNDKGHESCGRRERSNSEGDDSRIDQMNGNITNDDGLQHQDEDPQEEGFQLGTMLTENGRRSARNKDIVRSYQVPGPYQPPRRKNKKRREEYEDDEDDGDYEQIIYEQIVAPSIYGAGQSYEQPIDVDSMFPAESKCTLDINEVLPKYRFTVPFTVYDASGEGHKICPSLHSQLELRTLSQFGAAVQETHSESGPCFIVNPEDSAFKILSDQVPENQGSGAFLQHLRQKNLVVRDMDVQPFQFDEFGVQTLTRLTKPVKVQDQSVPPPGERSRIGNLKQILECARTPGGKVLDALHFPMHAAGFSSFPFSTDSASWKASSGRPGWEDEDDTPPISSIRWGLCSTAGAVQWWRVDPHGLGSFLQVMAGAKTFMVASSCKTSHDPKNFANIGTFLNEDYEADEPNSELWNVEAILLKPGTLLIMRPNQPHAVFTPEHTICHGGHFYALSTIQDSFFGIVHCFIAGRLGSSTEHAATRALLQRMIYFYHDVLVREQLDEKEYDPEHVPKLNNFASVLDLLTLCNLIILSNVLDFRTYLVPGQKPESLAPPSPEAQERWDMYDLNLIPVPERIRCMYARGQALDLLRWFSRTYEVLDLSTNRTFDVWEDIILRYLAHQVLALLVYKKQSAEYEVDGPPDCTLANLQSQIDQCLELLPELNDVMSSFDVKSIQSLAWPNGEDFVVKKCSSPVVKPSPDLQESGMTAADKKFLKGFKSNWVLPGEAMGEKRKRSANNMESRKRKR